MFLNFLFLSKALQARTYQKFAVVICNNCEVAVGTRNSQCLDSSEDILLSSGERSRLLMCCLGQLNLDVNVRSKNRQCIVSDELWKAPHKLRLNIMLREVVCHFEFLHEFIVKFVEKREFHSYTLEAFNRF